MVGESALGMAVSSHISLHIFQSVCLSLSGLLLRQNLAVEAFYFSNPGPNPKKDSVVLVPAEVLLSFWLREWNSLLGLS